MARKNPFENVMGDKPASDAPAKTEFAARGASKSISSTLDDLADKADRLLEGETIIELDPSLVDPSFLQDRIDHDPEAFEALKAAIEEDGQSTPILVRPHPKLDGRYMVVFGSRRRRVAEELGVKVRAVVKKMTDREHVIAQGQENAARSDLSFIERARMAASVIDQNYDSDNKTAMSALAVDKATLSKMLSVAAIPEPILSAIGSARSTGRDRWYELKKLLDRPTNSKKALEFVSGEHFENLSSEQRFDALHSALKQGKTVRKGASAPQKPWTPKDKRLEVKTSTRGKSFTLAVKARDHRAIEFGEFVSERLEDLYEQFKAETQK